MSGQEISFDDVASAAQALRERGLPVTLSQLQAQLPQASTASLQAQLQAWRAAEPAAPEAEGIALPPALASALSDWAQQLVHDAAAPLREALAHSDDSLGSVTEAHEQATARLEERDATIARLTIELRQAREVASNALVGKAKDQLAIDGKDAQIGELRREIERLLALSAAASDAKLTAEMELVGAVTARDNFAAELQELRAQLDAR